MLESAPVAPTWARNLGVRGILLYWTNCRNLPLDARRETNARTSSHVRVLTPGFSPALGEGTEFLLASPIANTVVAKVAILNSSITDSGHRKISLADLSRGTRPPEGLYLMNKCLQTKSLSWSF